MPGWLWQRCGSLLELLCHSCQDLNCQEEEDPMNKLKGQKIVSCRICKGDHWTTRCPYKDTLGPMQKELAEQLGLSTGEKEKLPGGAAQGLCGGALVVTAPALWLSSSTLSPPVFGCACALCILSAQLL